MIKIVELRMGDRRFEVWAGNGATLDKVFMRKVYRTNLLDHAMHKIAQFQKLGYIALSQEGLGNLPDHIS